MALAQTVGLVGKPHLYSAVPQPTALTVPQVTIPAVVSRSPLDMQRHAAPFLRKAMLPQRRWKLAAAAPGVDPFALLEAPGQVWDYYKASLASHPIATQV